ncbi:MAG: DUF4286 family protein [Tannerella sp.]|jgi:hypothetical protein|nr:DUF4286 family protein [Tannerella sp.]
MIIYHTTFHLSGEIYLKGLDYLKSVYVPAAMRSGKLHSPRMQRVLNEDGETNGVSLSVQFSVSGRDVLDEWINKEGIALHKSLMEKFSDEIAGFSTLLEEIDL